MCDEMNLLKTILKSEHKTKKNYEYLFNDFSSKMEQVRSKSKKRKIAQEKPSFLSPHSLKK